MAEPPKHVRERVIDAECSGSGERTFLHQPLIESDNMKGCLPSQSAATVLNRAAKIALRECTKEDFRGLLLVGCTSRVDSRGLRRARLELSSFIWSWALAIGGSAACRQFRGSRFHGSRIETGRSSGQCSS